MPNSQSIVNVKAVANCTPKLTHAQKVHAVTRLACFEQPTAIAKAMKEEFGIEITPQAIAFYDPTRYSSSPRPECWSVLFWKIRAEFLERIADIGAAHRTVRLRWLDQMTRAEMEKGNTAEARALLKQAADEMNESVKLKQATAGAIDGAFSYVDPAARIALLAAKLNVAIVPIGSPAAAGAGEPQPPGEPLPGNRPAAA